MKKIISALFIMTLVAGTATAQKDSAYKHHGKAGKHQKHHKMDAVDNLDLTAGQKAQMQALREDHKKQMQALKEQKNTLTAEQMKEKHKAIQAEHKTRMENILTQEQKTRLSNMEKEGKGQREGKKMQERQKGQQQEARKMQDDLNLSAQQKEKMASLRADFKTKSEAIRENDNLDKEAKKKAFKQLHESNKEEMRSVLTKEQIQKIESGRGKRGERGQQSGTRR